MTLHVASLIVITVFIGTAMNAVAQHSFEVNDMTCHIQSAPTQKCSAVPTLQTGVLDIARIGTFALNARYQSCFAVEHVTQAGKFRVSYFKDITRLELLTTHTTHIPDEAADLPRTLAIVHLNNSTLDGYWVDILPVIRGSRRHAEKIADARLQCAVNE